MHENPAKVQNAWKLTKLFFIRGNKKCQKQCYRGTCAQHQLNFRQLKTFNSVENY